MADVKKTLLVLFGFLFISFSNLASDNKDLVWVPDNGNGTYTNPIIYADYSDPDVVKVGDDFYMVSSSFSNFPGLPVLHSRDLVNWEIISHAADNYPSDLFRTPRHGNGIWAPSLRYHDGFYLIYFGDPDIGILMTRASSPEGPWSPLQVVLEGKGLIDACPLWDDNGKAYIVHGWAKSRAGFNGILTVREMNPDGKSISDELIDVYDGGNINYTIEGPKFYKRNGWYYIFAPAGGVKPGWQVVLRSKNIVGPYDVKRVLEQGSTDINGPHQGGLIELENGESWFLHFQDKDAYGRVIHLNPVQWIDDWPVIGKDYDGNGIGEPVRTYNKPDVGKEYPVLVPQTTDDFDSNKIGLQWQWEALPDDEWYSLSESPGSLRLYAQTIPDTINNLYYIPFVIGQKFAAESFDAVVKLSFSSQNKFDKTGIIVLGRSYASLSITQNENTYCVEYAECIDAYESDKKETIIEQTEINSSSVYFKVSVRENAVCNFSYSLDNRNFIEIGNDFHAAAGRWIGARIGLYAVSGIPNSNGYTDIDFIHFFKP